MQSIDTHVHFWKYDKLRDAWITNDMKILQQDYLPQQLELTLKRNEVTGCVAVQADQSELETHFLMELAKTNPIILGIVGWVDLQGEDLAKRLTYFSQFPIIKGWRHIAQAEANDFLLSNKFLRGMEVLGTYDWTYDILIYHYQLKAAVEMVSRFPNQAFVIDHCAKPDIRNKDISAWAILMKELGKRNNVYCKLSGLFTEVRWKEWVPADFYPYLDIVFESFGVDRLIFGSDWPVILLSGIYVQWKSLLEKYMQHFSVDDREKVFGGNARLFYKL